MLPLQLLPLQKSKNGPRTSSAELSCLYISCVHQHTDQIIPPVAGHTEAVADHAEIPQRKEDLYAFSPLDKKYVKMTFNEPVIRVQSQRRAEEKSWAIYGPYRSIIA